MSEIAAAVAAIFSSTPLTLLLVADALIYFAVLAALFRARHRIGIGAFFCALGVMHFLETYLASIVYVALPFGIVASPGSTVLFTGKLMLLLLVYIREDAVVVRQPIYGLLIGNLLLFALAFLMRHHGAGQRCCRTAHADFGFLDEMGALMVWGTLILFVDCILMILLYERSRACFGDRRLLLRLAVTGALILSFDQVAFYAGLRSSPARRLRCCSAAGFRKWRAVAIYAVLGAIYLRWSSCRASRKHPPRIIDVFDTADLSRALRGSVGPLRTRRADRCARSRPARASGQEACGGRSCWPAGRSACSSSTSIISRASTTASAMPPATTCCNGSCASWPRRAAERLVYSASAARNSW